MENSQYSHLNAQPVLEQLEQLIANYVRPVKIRSVYGQLSIFDWWSDNLNKSQMLQMKTFLKTAIKLGYTGYVCFKVGVSGCANGMWAHKLESTDGGSPNDPDILYRSFTPDYTYWSVSKNHIWYPQVNTPKQLEGLLQSI